MNRLWAHAGSRYLSALGTMSAEPLVWLDPYHQPGSLLEQQIYTLLAAGPKPLPEVVERLAEAEVYQGRRQGVWSLEIGAQALPALRSDVRRMLAALDGSQIAIETPPPLRAAAFASWQLQLCA